MTIDRLCRFAVILPLFATACVDGLMPRVETASSFGEANRQTMMAQIIDPDPQYEHLDPATSGHNAERAIERYRTDKVKQPERASTTQSLRSSGSGQSK